MVPSREDAWALVCEFTPNENLRRHMLAVEATMRFYARRHDADEGAWAIAGLIHDFDYEKYPDEHPEAGERILAERGWPDTIRRALLSHADHTGVPRESLLERALCACDDVTGLMVAVALVRPDKDLRQVKMKSVRKKWKNRAFAAGVDREHVTRAAEAFGVPLDEHLGNVLEAMQGEAEALGLAGSG